MTKEEWGDLAGQIRGLWPKSRFGPDAQAAWFQTMKMYTFGQVANAIDELADKEDSLPSIRAVKAACGSPTAYVPDPCECHDGYREASPPDGSQSALTFCHCPLGQRRRMGFEKWAEKSPSSPTTIRMRGKSSIS